MPLAMKNRIATLFVCCMAALPALAHAQKPDESAALPVGLYKWSLAEAPERLSLEIARTSEGWTAEVDGRAVDVATAPDGLVVTDGQDAFRGAPNESGQIVGYWLQKGDDRFYQDVVTRVTLTPAEGDVWSADFAIQPRPQTVYLDIFEDEKGEPRASVRNPERGNLLGAPRFIMERGAQGWQMTRGEALTYPIRVLADGRVQMDYAPMDGPIALSPVTAEQAASYFSRFPGSPVEPADAPAKLDDGWQTADPSELGFDNAALTELTRELAEADPRSQRPRLIHSLLVARQGKLVYEEYFHGHDRETVHDIRSLGKMFGSAMVGALQQQGHPIDADYRVVPGVLERAGIQLDDPRKRAITLGHLMTYSSGLDCNGDDPDSLGSESRMWEQQDQPDFHVFTAALPMLHDPGTRYAYCSGSANLVGAALAEVTGERTYETFHRLIAEPLQFQSYHSTVAPNGEGYLGGGHYMRPRDMLKLGAVYASGGLWNGRRIVPESWVEESTRDHMPITAETTGTDPEWFADNSFGGVQGYNWRIDTVRTADREYRSYEATGNGGQLLIVVPELDLAVAMTGANYGWGGVWGRWRNEIVGGHVIPALTRTR